MKRTRFVRPDIKLSFPVLQQQLALTSIVAKVQQKEEEEEEEDAGGHHQFPLLTFTEKSRRKTYSRQDRHGIVDSLLLGRRRRRRR